MEHFYVTKNMGWDESEDETERPLPTPDLHSTAA